MAETDTQSVVVARYKGPAQERPRPNTLVAVEVVRERCNLHYHYPDQDHDHWYTQSVYPLDVKRDLYAYDQPGAANETAAWRAIRQGMGWDHEGFPNGLIRQ